MQTREPTIPTAIVSLFIHPGPLQLLENLLFLCVFGPPLESRLGPALFGIAFFLIGVTLFGIGLLGEYIGRIYEQVRNRPRYFIHEILERKE